MTTVVGERDALLQVTSPRYSVAGSAVLLNQSAIGFHIAVGGANDPASITFTASFIGLAGPATFSATGGTLTISGNVATLTYANMPGATASVTASVTVNGVTFTSNPCFVTKVLDGSTGSPGPTGARGAGQYFATGSAWSDATADAATPGANIAGDVVTISNSTTFVGVKGWSGSAWVAVSPTYDGGAIFPGSVTVNQINANSLIIRDAAGNPIVGVGVPLGAGYEAPGTFSPPSKGGAINDDPAIEYPAYWSVPTGIAISTGAGTGSVGDTFFNAPSYNGTDRVVMSTRSHAIDPNRVYSLTANLFTNTGNNRVMYVLVNFYDAAGSAIASSASSPNWGGVYSGYAFGAVPPSAGSWTRCGANFGPGTGRSIPATAKTCKIGVWFQYTGSGSSSVQHGAQDIRLVDVNDITATNAVINDATTGLAQRLRSNAATILSGGAGVTAGTLTYDTSGNRIAGFGMAFNQRGIVGFNSSGVATITMNVSTGAIAIAGDISGSNGTFSGTITAAGFINSTLASTVETGAAAGTTAKTAQDNKPVVSINHSSVPTTKSNPITAGSTVLIGTAVGTVTAANGGAIYQWSVVITGVNLDTAEAAISFGSPTSTTTTLSVKTVADTGVTYCATLTVTDAKGFVGSASFAKTIQVGTAL